MAVSLQKRRVVATALENVAPGTAASPTASTDSIPLIRDAEYTPRPIAVDRPTLRQTLTSYASIYPGRSLIDFSFTFELHATSAFSGDATTNAERPLFTRVAQACGMVSVTEGSLGGLHAYKPTALNAGTGPLRHGEIVTATGVVSGDNWTAFGDTWVDDGTAFIWQGSTGTLTGTRWTGASSTTAIDFTTYQTNKIFGWYPRSDANAQTTWTYDLYIDGKKHQFKGCMGNMELEFNHGDAVLVNVNVTGVYNAVSDTALPSNANELHKYPPTFLGSRTTLRRPIHAPATAEKYGSDGSGANTITGALTSMKMRTGNNIVMHQNSLDSNGVNYAILTARAPEGEFNPDEVRESEFSFLNYFASGLPLRFKTTLVGPDAASYVFDNPATANQNIYDVLIPGVVISGLGDGDRDGINAWNGAFKMTGGNYTAATALSETLGTDNEFVIVHR